MSDVDLFYVYCAPAATAATGAGGSTTTGAAAGGAGGAVTGSGGAMGGAGGAMGGAGGAMGGAGGSGTATVSSSSSSTSSTTSAGSGGGSSGDCVAADGSIVAGELPSANALLCGQGSGPTSVVANKNMMNGVEYAVAVAATDTLGNPGVLSELACGTPQSVTDFFEQYRAAGGQAGGGFCNCELAGGPHDGRLPLAGLLLLALTAAWRRERGAGRRA